MMRTLLAEDIYRLSVDGQLRRTLAENLFKRAKEEFSLANMCRVQERSYGLMLERSQHQKRWSAVICGAYGRGNSGDEAILQAIVAQMREIDPHMPLTVLSRDKLDTRQKNKTNAIYIFNIYSFFKNLRRSQIFINGGQLDSGCNIFALIIFPICLPCGRHGSAVAGVIMYGCGIGPIKKGFNQRILPRCLIKT